MRNDSRDIIRQIGETDQLYLNENTPQLALERADLRLQLVTLSQLKQERVHFLQEAIVLLEQARISFEEMPMSLYLELSLNLAKAYMLFYEITQEDKYALVTQQVLKSLAIQNNGDVYLFLAYASMARKEPSLARHWLVKYSKTAEFDLDLLQHHHAFNDIKDQRWFLEIVKTKLN